MNRIALSTAVVAVLLAAGCFPILLDVDAQGRILIPRAEGVFVCDAATGKTTLLARSTGEGQPAWARWSPDGKMALVAMVIGDNDETRLAVVNAKGKATEIGRFKAVATALWAPDGKSVTVSEAGMQGVELKRVTLADRKTSTVLSGCLASHAHLPNGRLLAVKTDGEVEGTNLKTGQLVVVDPASGASQAVVSVTCDAGALFDLSPDGKQVLMVTGKAATDEHGNATTVSTLELITLEGGKRQTVQAASPQAAFWSPDGKRVLIVEAGGDDTPASLVVVDTGGKGRKTIATGMATSAGGFHQSTSIYPSWVGADAVIYFEQSASYGASGKTLHLVRVGADGKGRTDLQYAIERGVAAAMGVK